MNKQIICVFQDCVMCGDRGKEIKQIIMDNNLNVRKVSFASDEGRELIAKAVFSHGIKNMPFYTDGKKFSTNLSSFIVKKDKKVINKRGKK